MALRITWQLRGKRVDWHLAFRNRLRSHAEDRLRYEALKRKLAKEDWPDTEAYARAKSEVVEEIIARALQENSDTA